MGNAMSEMSEAIYAGRNCVVRRDGTLVSRSGDPWRGQEELAAAYADLWERKESELRDIRIMHGVSWTEPAILDTYEDNCGIQWIVRSDATWRTSTGKDDSADFKPHWNEPTVWSRWLVDKHTRAKKAQERN